MKLNIWLAVILSLLLCSCATSPRSQPERVELDADARAAVESMTARDPSIRTEINRAEAYAVFPNVGKGAFVVGGAFGQGVVFQKDRIIGYASITAGSVGGQIGGRSFRELILLQTEEALNRFKYKDAAFGVEATAVAITEGSSAQVNYHEGVAVIVQQRGGLMADASFSGQTFTFTPATSESPESITDISSED